MVKYLIISFLFVSGFNKTQVVEYIDKKMKVCDPIYQSFEIGDNGETKIVWVNDGFWREYRFNIREIKFTAKVSPEGNNYILLESEDPTNNAIQKVSREDVARVGNKVIYSNHQSISIESISGRDNNISISNALKYLKVLSIKDNESPTSENRDPFIYK